MVVINKILNILLLALLFQLCTISHEFGHAIPALIFSKDKVSLILGVGDREIKKFSFGMLEIKIKRFNPFIGFVLWDGKNMNRLEGVLCCAGGPIVSMLIGITFIIIGKGIGENLIGEIFTISAYVHFYQFICTAIPIKYPKFGGSYGGYYSDGYNVLSLIRND